jgi:glycosyltransferase involved in cell wall biosynthesis
MEFKEHTYIIIPSYRPGDELIGLIELILGYGHDKNCRILLVDDGSGLEYRSIFRHLSRNLRVTLLTHEQNQGKGAALKTAFNYLIQRGVSRPVVTADADGQHTPSDIARVAIAALQNPDSLILGCRDFKKAMNMPFRSRFGNFWSIKVFRLLTGMRVSDIQTGLRGIPSAYLPILTTFPQNRFDFEMVMLLDNASRKRFPFLEVSIEPVYADEHTSHFRPLRDSLRILRSLKSSGY